MITTPEQRKELEEAARPLLKFLNDHCDPHTIVQVSYCDVELLSASVRITNDEFVKD